MKVLAIWQTGGIDVRLFYGTRNKLRVSAVLSGTLLLASPVLAFASEAAEESAGSNPLIPNMGEFIPMLVGFILLWVLLAKFGWPTITGMLDKRVNTIKESLEKAEAAKIESERLLEEQKAGLDEARHQAAEIIAQAKASAEVLKSEITAQAQEQAEAMLARATAAIETEKKTAIAQLQGSMADLSVSVAGRLIGQDLSDEEHRRIIERYLAEAGSFNAN
jgi:F-type H+-transporting ATPase subunit b